MLEQNERKLSQPNEEPALLVIETELSRTQLREPIGILALDSTEMTAKALEPPTEESHLSLQKELLHTIDLFTACLAESKEFRNFDTPPREGASKARATTACE